MKSGEAAARRLQRAPVVVMLVLALAGLLFTSSARLARSQGERHPENLAQLIEVEEDRVREIEQTVDELDEQLARVVPVTGPDVDEAAYLRDAVAAGSIAVTGPGVRVALDDAPPQPAGSTLPADALVVHQQDLEAVINALWAGGAEAMTLQGQRVLTTTAFRCVGNVLSLHGRVYSPPYVVEAIGDPAALLSALDAAPEIATYRQWVDAVGLGWDVSTPATLDLPARTVASLEHAYLPDDVDAFG
ncbi:DUF881 domain-containing protein [Sanguibacter sp. A247]|uniref:DUF881 domain-containing protein n=1 Tax=unclassified Sanguibacter TaxID=2645534 RepID=UPI003FD8BAA5